MAHNVSIKDVAHATGFSISTVSYALRNNPKISAKTRQLIADKAKELGYHSDPAMRQFMSYVRDRREKTITQALAFLNTTQHRHLSDIGIRSKKLFEAMKARAQHFGYHLDELWIGDMGKDAQGLDRILTTRGIHGLVLSNFHERFKMPKLNWERLTAVCFDAAPTNCPMHTVGHSHFRGMRMAVEKCRELGYTRIGLATSNPDHNIQRDQWLASYLFEISHHAELESIPIYEGELVDPDICENTWGYRPAPDTKIFKQGSFLDWVDQTKPQVVVTYVHQAVKWLREAGYEIPKDIGFALIDYDDERGDISGVNQLVEDLGRAAINKLVANIEQNELGIPTRPEFTRLGGVWHSGGTLKQQ